MQYSAGGSTEYIQRYTSLHVLYMYIHDCTHTVDMFVCATQNPLLDIVSL